MVPRGRWAHHLTGCRQSLAPRQRVAALSPVGCCLHLRRGPMEGCGNRSTTDPPLQRGLRHSVGAASSSSGKKKPLPRPVAVRGIPVSVLKSESTRGVLRPPR
ncbi:hypothetical protein NDU88_002624 [Pleurodeles waltl]|uniref:Uncharacterized protein n=1 Tax=Pleurodeles waltl TaxID=8319 RepID=A0AAV7W082_PLEWA|nr:hypothetical protein NDU88_002624 [Pleurodeles waltl]